MRPRLAIWRWGRFREEGYWNMRLFDQTIGARAIGKETNVTDMDETGFETLQGFADPSYL
ncbi:hypothetical protein [Mesorhizobium sp. LjNodule214]|uniref:hypothetical protein n=1 Tax=Mesorhizobium sp. LjNodule214 TaxID=3342252 RepID=UPI003ECF3703